MSRLWVLQAIQVLQAMGFPDQAMGLSDDIEMESNRRVRDPCDPGSVSDLIAMDFQMILKLAVAANRIHGVEYEVIAHWPHMPNLIQLVQGTEQVLPTAMIRYMVVVLAR